MLCPISIMRYKGTKKKLYLGFNYTELIDFKQDPTKFSFVN